MSGRVDGDKLRQIRRARLLERTELAEVSKVSYSTIYKMEVHGHLPRFQKLKAVAKVLKVRPEDLLEDESDAPLPVLAAAGVG